MAMGTRSKAGRGYGRGDGERRKESARQTLANRLKDLQCNKGSAYEEVDGVKIKQEVVQDNLSSGIQQQDETERVDQKRHRNNTEVLGTEESVTEYSTISDKRYPGIYSTGARLTAQGKRRLQSTTTQKRSKKHYQDIRIFAQQFYNDKANNQSEHSTDPGWEGGNEDTTKVLTGKQGTDIANVTMGETSSDIKEPEVVIIDSHETNETDNKSIGDSEGKRSQKIEHETEHKMKTKDVLMEELQEVTKAWAVNETKD